MKKIFFIGLSIIVLYSILIYAYGFDCSAHIDQTNYYTMDNYITALGGEYYIGCSLYEVSASVRILVVRDYDNLEILNVVDYNVQNSSHFFEAEDGVDYHVYVISSGTEGTAMCMPL